MKSGFKIGAQCAMALLPLLAATLPALQPAPAEAHDSLDPTVLAPQARPGSVARAGVPRYGIVANPAEPRQLEAIRKAGAKLAPVDVRWRDVEPSPTAPANFNWSKYDPLFANLRRGGLTPFVIVQGAPAWARAPGSSGIIRSDQFGEFAQFVEALVTRYRGQTTYWSFYNEPDCNGEVPADAPSACWGNAGAAYARMLQAVYPAVKRADPKALVIFGGIAFDNFQPSNGFARNFVDDALAAGAGRAFDVFNFHYYPAFRQVWEPHGVDVMGKAKVLRTTLAKHGADKPIILTELGTGSQGQGTSPEIQARYVIQGQARSLAAGLESVLWYDATDNGEYGFGLMKADFRPRPAYTAYQTFVRTVGNRPFQRVLTKADLGTEGVEGYEFGGSDGKRVIVAWSVGDTAHQVKVAGDGGRRISLVGAATPLTARAGSIGVSVGPQPVFLEISARPSPQPNPRPAQGGSRPASGPGHQQMRADPVQQAPRPAPQPAVAK